MNTLSNYHQCFLDAVAASSPVLLGCTRCQFIQKDATCASTSTIGDVIVQVSSLRAINFLRRQFRKWLLLRTLDELLNGFKVALKRFKDMGDIRIFTTLVSFARISLLSGYINFQCSVFLYYMVPQFYASISYFWRKAFRFGILLAIFKRNLREIQKSRQITM